jgi:glycosyltransferase involved in cell wall biosynthesis
VSRVAFSWRGLPFYAACLLSNAIKAVGEPCDVIGTPPTVPVKGMEEALGSDICWIDHSAATSWAEIGLEIPKLFFQSGWGYPAINSLGSEVRRNGGRVVGMSDANWRGDFRQVVLGALAFRMRLRGQFDAMLVPGRQGRRLMRHYGFRDSDIYEGMYGANPDVFVGGPPLSGRPQEFLYVGQLVDRKNILRLAQVFIRFAEQRPDWKLRLCGSGDLRDQIPKHPNIIVQDFLQAEELAALYRDARFFILPSLQEAWGLVVHEAALSGCALLLSDKIGSADDLAGKKNALSFVATDDESLLGALHQAAAMDDRQLGAADDESRTMARNFGPERFAREVASMVDRFG